MLPRGRGWLALVLAGGLVCASCVRLGFVSDHDGEAGAGATDARRDTPDSAARDASELRDLGRREAGPDGPRRDGQATDLGVGLKHVWSKGAGSASVEYVRGLAVDGTGNVFITGDMYGDTDFGGGVLVNKGPYDVYYVSYSSTSGAHRWSKGLGGTANDVGRAVAASAAGASYVVGHFSGTGSFGGSNLSSVGMSDIFISAWSQNGVNAWSQRYGSAGWDDGLGVAVDSSGNIYVTGYLAQGTSLGGPALSCPGGTDAFLASYNPNNTHRWSKCFGGTGFDAGQAVAVDSAGNVYITGYTNGGIDFGGGVLPGKGSYDVFLASFSSASGAYRYSKLFGGTGSDIGYGLAADAAGNTCVTGTFVGAVDFGTGSAITAPNGGGIFIAGFTSSGAHRFSRGSGSAVGEGRGAVTDTNGNCYAVGRFSGTASLGGTPLSASSSGSTAIFAASYTGTGTHRWSRAFSNTGSALGYGIAVDGANNVYLAGEFSGTISFGGALLSSLGSSDVCIAKLAQ